MKKTITIASHNGSHHADDVFGTTVLLMLHPDAEVVRTREPDIIAKADFAVDVGGVWDPEKGRFDHHQKGFDGKRANGVTYASAGLVWAAHGVEYLNAVLGWVEGERAQEIWKAIDDALVQHLDMADTGEAIGAPGYFGLSMLLSTFNMTRLEERRMSDAGRARAKNEAFLKACATMQQLLQRLVKQFYDEFEGQDLVRNAKREAEGKILVLPEAGLSWYKVVCSELPEVLFVVYPDSTDKQYQVRTVPVEPESFTARRDLPEAWAGLRDADLAKVTGVEDAVFCHNGRFIAGAVSLEGALAMAERALPNP